MNLYINLAILHFLNSLVGKSAAFDSAILFFGKYLAYLVPIILLSYFFFVPWERRLSYFRVVAYAIVSASIALLITDFIKYFYPTDRPYVSMPENIKTIFLPSDNGSFPSGHATFFSALAFYFYFSEYRKFGISLLVSAILIAIFRVVDGIHYPIDITCGFLVGFAATFLVARLVNSRQRKSQN